MSLVVSLLRSPVVNLSGFSKLPYLTLAVSALAGTACAPVVCPAVKTVLCSLNISFTSRAHRRLHVPASLASGSGHMTSSGQWDVDGVTDAPRETGPQLRRPISYFTPVTTSPMVSWLQHHRILSTSLHAV